MATAAVGVMGGRGTGPWIRAQKKICRTNMKKARVYCLCSSAFSDPYHTLRIERGASESDVKKAFRKLALQYHPDVCKGRDCGVQFSHINQAYSNVMSDLREETILKSSDTNEGGEEVSGMEDPDYELWEEWMGWEGGGIRDYSSHINPYI